MKDSAKAADVPCEVIRVIHDHPYQAISETANTSGCDLIFIASHGRRGMAALVLGSETTKVVNPHPDPGPGVPLRDQRKGFNRFGR